MSFRHKLTTAISCLIFILLPGVNNTHGRYTHEAFKFFPATCGMRSNYKLPRGGHLAVHHLSNHRNISVAATLIDNVVTTFC